MSVGEYVVLARRHRPLRFDQVIGQEHVTRTLRNAIARDRVHHAYLFTGSRGVGKTTVARILSRALNCLAQDGPTPDPCGECEGCNAKVDVFEIDGASHTGVDDIRELRENVRYLPAQLRKKIYIIDEVHMLSTSAFNALLKTLEEPPPHVVFMFATTEPHKIPATILSRCQRFDFKRVPLAVVVDHLVDLAEQEGVAIAREALALIARAGEGSVRDALSLLDQAIAYGPVDGETVLTATRVAEVLGVADRRVLFALSGAILAGNSRDALAVIDELFTQGLDLAQLSKRLLAHLRDLVVVRAVDEPGALVDATAAELAELSEQARAEGGVLWRQHFDTFARAAEEIARSSFPRLLLEMSVIEMVHAEPLLPLGDLLERLEGLEGRLGRGPSSGPSSGASPARRRGGGGGGAGGSGGGKTSGAKTSGAKTSGAKTSGAKTSDTKTSGAKTNGGRSGPSGAPVDWRSKLEGGEPESNKSAAPVDAAPDTAPVDTAPVDDDEPPVGANGSGNGKPVTAPLGRWRTLLQAVEREQPLAASVYLSGSLVHFEGDEIELAYPDGSFELTRAGDGDKRKAFEAACARALGRVVRLRVRALALGEAERPEIAEQTEAAERARERAERAEQLRQEALSHPITRTLIDDFGARIERVTTNADGDAPSSPTDL